MKKMNLLKKIFAGITAWQLMLAMFVPVFYLVTPQVVSADSPTPSIQLLTSPVDGSYVAYDDLVFNWGESLDEEDHSPIYYKFQISTTPDVKLAPGSTFSGPIVYERKWRSEGELSPLTSTSLDASDAGIPLTAGNTYYWHVRAEDKTGGALANRNNWSEVWSFTMNSAPSTPDLYSPINGKILNTKTPTLDWSDSIDGEGDTIIYEFQVDMDGDWTTVISSGSTLDSFFTIPIEWDYADSLYYWRVRATDINGQSSEWTIPWSFIVDTTAPDGTYDSKLDVVLNPTNDNNPDVTGKYYGAITEESQFIGRTVEVPKGDIVRIEVAYQPANTTTETLAGIVGSSYYYKLGMMDGYGNYYTDDIDPFFLAFADRGLYGSLYSNVIPTVSVLPDGEYKVFARSYDLAGNFTDELIEESLVIDTVSPSVPLGLVVSEKTDTTISLSWSASTDIGSGISGYKVFWGKETGNYTNVMHVGNLTNYTVSGLSPDTQYYFSVVAYDYAMNESAKSMEVAGITNVETFNFNVLTPIVAAATVTGEGIDGNIQGAVDENQEPEKEVKGTENNKNESEDETSGAFLGLMWYWWILILAGLGIGYWWFVGGKRRKDEK